jgi:hypothetical protein
MRVNEHAHRQVFSTLLCTAATAITAALFLSAPALVRTQQLPA